VHHVGILYDHSFTSGFLLVMWQILWPQSGEEFGGIEEIFHLSSVQV